ncbi:MAG: DEAD/DEAH box helicase family protein [bacterium]
MEFKFDPEIEYQKDAIKSIVDIFAGSSPTVSNQKYNYDTKHTLISLKTVSNKLIIDKERLLENIKKVQKRNEIQDVTTQLESMDFSVEMETGTGKTYIYLRTILELYLEYKMKKFIIVVPSVAIREGVLKTLKITEDHFKKIKEYSNIKYNYNEYDSSNLTLLKQFAYNNSVEIMVMTIDSFNKEINIINRYQDSIGGKPIELIKRTNPILILDEPQNMESKKQKEALSDLNPLMKLRYSATHRETYNLVYRLSPVEAHKKGLVKKIEVLSVVEEDDYSNVYIEVQKFDRSTRGIKAKLKIYKQQKSGIKRATTTVYDGDDLYKKSNGIQEYKNFVVNYLDLKEEIIKFSNGITLKKGDIQGLNRHQLMEVQIEETIEEHFRKQYKLKEKGIKILSLFFIDKVDNFIKEDGFIRKTFIKAYNKIRNIDEEWASPYKDIKADKVMASYFARKEDGEYYSDRSTSYMKSSKETFDLIMNKKEQLLSFEEPVQFIFSHSALREGWDNPNVFNICTLNESYSEIKKRQEIGRGIRLPVDQKGNRMLDQRYILTVIANESYKDFVAKLQTEYKKSEDVPETDDKENRKPVPVKLKEKNELSTTKWEDFKRLWERISQKTEYQISINSNMLVEKCIEEINNINIEERKIRLNKVDIDFISEDNIDDKIIGSGSRGINSNYMIDNFLERIEQKTKLTKKTILSILTKVDNLNLLLNDYYKYIESIIKIINKVKKSFSIIKIEYYKINDKYEMSLFQDLEGYDDNMTKVSNSIYEYVVSDSSEAEKKLAKALDNDPRVKFFLKLPNWFTVPTPIGKYVPDWAIVVENTDLRGEEKDKLYLVRESKSGDMDNLRPSESQKIYYAKKHFKEIFKCYNDANYEDVNIPKTNNFDIKDILNF